MPDSSHFDVIVVGGGIVGAATAEAMVRRGQRVLLVDQYEPGHTRGSSHGDGRIIRLAYPEPVYVKLARLAYDGWEDVATRAREPLVLKTGGWDCGPADSTALRDLETNFRRFDIAYERLTATESNQRFPHFHLERASEAIYQADAGVVLATRAVVALWRLVREGGGSAVSGERIVAVDVEGERVEVRTDSGRQWRAARLVVAAGGWTGRLLQGLDLSLPLTVTQEQVAYFPVAGDLSHEVGRMPVFIDHHTSSPFYGLPQISVQGVKVGWHRTGRVIDPDGPRVWDEENLEAVKQFVRERLPHLAVTPIEQDTCLYTNTPDYHFILDRHPRLPNVVIGAGFSGHGFKFGPALGSVLAALSQDEQPPIELDTFVIHRFGQPDLLHARTGA